jgi:hypothetical protein
MGTQTMQYAVIYGHNPPSAIRSLPSALHREPSINYCPMPIVYRPLAVLTCWQPLPVVGARPLPVLAHSRRCSHFAGAGSHPLPMLARCRCQCSPVAGAGTLTSPTLTRSCIHCPLFARGLNSVLGPKVEHLLPVLSTRSSILLQTTKRYRVSLRRTTKGCWIEKKISCC